MNNTTIKKEEIRKAFIEKFCVAGRENEYEEVFDEIPNAEVVLSFINEQMDSLIATAREEAYDKAYNAGFVAGVRRWEKTQESPSVEREEMKEDSSNLEDRVRDIILYGEGTISSKGVKREEEHIHDDGLGVSQEFCEKCLRKEGWIKATELKREGKYDFITANGFGDDDLTHPEPFIERECGPVGNKDVAKNYESGPIEHEEECKCHCYDCTFGQVDNGNGTLNHCLGKYCIPEKGNE